MEEEESVREVLYETRCHASGCYSSDFPLSRQQSNEASGGGFISSLLPRGITQLKERWTEYRNPKKLRKYASLFVSSNAERIAVAIGNQITILWKDNNYQEPIGIFTSGRTIVFVCGTWSEVHDVLGLVDDSGTLYFIKANGEEITRVTNKNLKVSLPIICLMFRDNIDANNSFLCTFTILASDGLLHDVEIGQDTSTFMFSAHALISGAVLKKQFPKNIFCVDYHPRLSLLAMVGTAGSAPFLKTPEDLGLHSLSLWQKSSSSDLEMKISTEFEGLYSEAKGYIGQLTSPKVLISPQGKFIATLDVRGFLHIFKFDEEQYSLSSFCSGKKQDSRMTSNMPSIEMELLNDILDFTWWSGSILAVVQRDGSFSMFDVSAGVKLQDSDPVHSMPVLERAEELSGLLFLLESKLSGQNYESSAKMGTSNGYLIEQFDYVKLLWSLVSFTETSVSEMFDSLIHNRKYQDALKFADRHGLDKDNVLKSQWLSSEQGVHEINTLLSPIRDQVFVLSECVNCVGPTEDAVNALLAYGLSLTNNYKFSESEDYESSQIWDFRMARLKLLQFRDRLETFLGINMGRYSMQEYNKFRSSPVNEAAVVLAESGKIGALNLLFKRHPYSLTPFLLEVLAAIPETVPVQTYAQLLPGNSPPASTSLREEDWVECDKMVSFINRLPETHSSCMIRTELIVKKYMGLYWPSTTDLLLWYRNRAIDIDTLSGQLDNCKCLIDFACRKGISELQQFLEDISYLHQLIYSDDYGDKNNFCLSLSAWEQLPDYERFKLMLMGMEEVNVIERLRKRAVPFMQRRSYHMTSQPQDEVFGRTTMDEKADSFLVRWMKEISSENKLEVCLIVIEEGCKEMENNCFFRDEAEVVDCALQCIYLCSATDRWTTMASILSKLPHLRVITGSECDGLKARLKLAEAHTEAGRLLAVYQVPKSISFFLEAHADEKGVKQIFRLILSKFIRRPLVRSDNEWANMWQDLLSLREKGFPFLDLEYVLVEFCRGLLKAGKFSLARNYLKGTASVGLAADKAETLVIQAAREYFFSASSLDCSEIWKAKECLNILPSSRNVRAESDVMDAVTVKLPNLGVHILPMQFKQIKDPMEIIKLAITSQAGAYLNVDELVEVAKLLGLISLDEISAVQEAIAREAAVAGDLQLAFDLCVVLAKKGHGPVWDLCAALARGPTLENMDISSRKHLLGFSLSHCDEESIGELLHAWKDLDMQGQCETLLMLTERELPESLVHSCSINSYPHYSTDCTHDVGVWSVNAVNVGSGDQEAQFNSMKNMLSQVAKNLSADNGYQWESLMENGKISSFAALHLPWLLEVSSKAEVSKKHISGSTSAKQYVSIRTQAVLTILSWLARSGFAPQDDLIASLAKSIMEPPVSEEEDVIGCSFLLNLVDAFYGVNVIEEIVKMRENYCEISSIMNIGLIYGLLHNFGIQCVDPAQRRVLLLREFQQKQKSFTSDERNELDKAQTTFWREWKMKLEEQKRLADQSRILEQIIPGVETARFLAGDRDYIESVVFSFIESVKLEKKLILKDILKLAHMYGLDNTKVLLHYMSSILVSKFWTVNDIAADISEFKEELFASAPEAIKIIILSVYPMIKGQDKERLACIYGLLSQCYLQLVEQKEPLPIIDQDLNPERVIRSAHFCRIVGQECLRVSFICGLNYKNIARLNDLNWDNFNDEVCSHIDENNVDLLANMVHNLVGIYGDSVPEGILSSQDVYKHHMENMLTALETRLSSENVHCFIGELEQTYDVCLKYVKFIENQGVLNLMKRFFTLILPIEKSLRSISFDSTWQECLIMLLNLWLRLMNDMRELKFLEDSDESFCSEGLVMCLKYFLSLIIKGKLTPTEGWGTLVGFVNCGLSGAVDQVFNFYKAMLFSGCGFAAVADLFTDATDQLPGSVIVSDNKRSLVKVQDLPYLYLSILETILPDFGSGSLEQQNLHHVLTSLSKLEGNLEELKKVRHAVWKRMAEISNNLELPSHVRVYLLELMQCIAATGKHASELQDIVLPWEGWDNVQSTAVDQTKITDHGISRVTDTSDRLTNTLVALKSSQLLSGISPSMEITPADLLTIESAVSCFLKVSKSATSESHVDTLIAILREWEGLFVGGKIDSPKLSDDVNSWINDDWDEEWENFVEEPKEKEIKSSSILSLHPLHACWMEIFEKLIVLSRYRDLLKLIDQYTGETMQILVDEDGARCLSQITLEIDCFLAVKLMLLFPFKSVQLQCLDAVEGMLKRGMPDEVGRDIEFLILMLSSGIIGTIITKSSYDSTFSYVCYIVGNFSRECQEFQLSNLKHVMTVEDKSNKNLILPFTRLIFPCFISELVKADQQILAGFLVTKLMHTNASLSLLNVAEANLRRYFQKQLQMLPDDESSWVNMNFGEFLVINSMSNLRGRLPSLIQSAVSLLPADGR